MSMTTLRTGLAANLATITGLRTSATVPDDPKPPVAVVMPQRVIWDTSFARGLDQYEFVVLVIVGRVDERTAQNTLDAYCAPTGAGSIKTAIERDKTLGGAANTLRVTEMRNYTAIQIAENTYLSAEFAVTVYA